MFMSERPTMTRVMIPSRFCPNRIGDSVGFIRQGTEFDPVLVAFKHSRRDGALVVDVQGKADESGTLPLPSFRQDMIRDWARFPPVSH